MKRPSGDKAGPNSGQGDRVSRLSPVPSALMDQTSWRLSKTIRPESEVRSMAPEPPGSADTVEEGSGDPAGWRRRSWIAGACRQDERRRHTQSNHRSTLHPPSLLRPLIRVCGPGGSRTGKELALAP